MVWYHVTRVVFPCTNSKSDFKVTYGEIHELVSFLGMGILIGDIDLDICGGLLS